MSTSDEEASDSTDLACMMCRRAEADPDICGPKLDHQGICVHLFCLHFANGISQQRSNDGVRLEYIRHIIQQAVWKDCFVCGHSGATITCRESGCNRSFHLPCAVAGECITQYFGLYRTFCWEHRPEQEVVETPEEDTTCLICLESVEQRLSYDVIVCPACKHAWFHRSCIQKHAIYAGYYCLSCPHWPLLERRHTYAAMNERHSRCDASECLCPGGREQAEDEGPWQLLLCCSCAAEGTHRLCSSLESTASWECSSCAGPATASSTSSEFTSPGTTSQPASGPSHDAQAPRTSSPSTGSMVASEPPQGSPVIETGRHSNTPGPERLRNRSRLLRRAQNTSSRPRGHRQRSRARAPSAETSTPSQAALGLSHSSPAPETSSPSITSQLPLGSSCGSPVLESSSRSNTPGPEQLRDGSRLQRRAQNPFSRPRRQHRTSPAPTQSAGTRPPSPAE